MANSPTYQLSRPELIKSLRWLTACATDQRDMFILSMAQRLLMSDSMHSVETVLLSAIECGYQSREELIELTGRCDASVRRALYRLLGSGVIVARLDDQARKLYFLR